MTKLKIMKNMTNLQIYFSNNSIDICQLNTNHFKLLIEYILQLFLTNENTLNISIKLYQRSNITKFQIPKQTKPTIFRPNRTI